MPVLALQNAKLSWIVNPKKGKPHAAVCKTLLVSPIEDQNISEQFS